MITESYKEKVQFIVDLHKAGVFDIYTAAQVIEFLQASKNI